MNRKKALLFIALLEAMFFAIFTMLFMQGAIKLATFIAVILTFSVIANVYWWWPSVNFQMTDYEQK